MKFLSDILAKAGLITDGVVMLNNTTNASVDTDRFVVLDNGTVKYRTGDQVLSDIGGVSTARTITINGVSYDLSADRSWDLNTIEALTTTGTSGAATYIGKTLNIPIYQAQGNYITQLSGEATAMGPGNATVTLNNDAVIGKVLNGLNIAGGSISSTDSIVVAFGKVQNQINGLFSGVTYQGTWNAATNTPTLTSSVGTKGYYYVVSVPGNTNLNGITDWKMGDWAIFNGSTWDKVDNTDAVVSVNGYTGVVVLTYADVGAPPATRTLTINGTGYDLSADRSWTVGDVRTDGSYADPTWITSLAWSKIINTPTTLAGYGITDAVSSGTTLTINGTSYDLSANRTWNVGTVTSIGTSGPLTGGTITSSGTIGITQASTSTNGFLSSTDWNTFNNKVSYTDALARGALSAGTGISYNSATGVITNSAPDQTVTLTAGTNISVTGTYPNFTINNTSTANGTVTSVGLSAPTGFSVSGSPVTSSGTLALGFAAGYSLPTDASQTNWNTAFNKRLSSANLSASTLTLTLADASTVTTSVPTFNQNTTGTAASLSAVLSSTLGGAGSVNGILKANGSGVVSAAVAGTDYVVPSALSSYLPLTAGSGQALSGDLYANARITFQSASSTSPTTAGQEGWNSTVGRYLWPKAGSSFDVTEYNSAGATVRTVATGTIATTLYGALSGTSLSMSGNASIGGGSAFSGLGGGLATNGSGSSGIQFRVADAIRGYSYAEDAGVTSEAVGSTYFRVVTNAAERLRVTSGGNTLIKTTTDNGTDALQVNGTIRADQPIYAGGNSGGYRALSMGAIGGGYGSVGYGNVFGAASDTYASNDFASKIVFQSGGFNFQTAASGTAGNTITWATPFSIANSGAATFSSSVTANTNTTIGNANPVYNANSGTSASLFSSASSWLELATSSTTDGNGGLITFNNTNIVGSDKRMAAISGIRDGANNSGALSFVTWNAGTPSEKLRISPSGAATFSSSVTVGGALSGTSASFSGATQLATSSGRVLIKTTTDNGTDALQVNGSGLFTGDITAFGSPSDLRLKDIKEIVPNALQSILQLNGYRFDWKEVNHLTNIKEDIGVVAQEVEKVLPELARHNDDGTMSVRYQGLTAVLIEAIKEQQAQIEDLKNQITELKENK